MNYLSLNSSLIHPKAVGPLPSASSLSPLPLITPGSYYPSLALTPSTDVTGHTPPSTTPLPHSTTLFYPGDKCLTGGAFVGFG
mmetsp:Transcript_28966/g.46852  ORF Transcript_28966/g.46852 Transcript_28966/m.46852 type:complete len:83 (-) Transcript_28966:76-324(-)